MSRAWTRHIHTGYLIKSWKWSSFVEKEVESQRGGVTCPGWYKQNQWWTQEEEKPEETAELEAVITRQKQEKLREKRQQSQKHRRGNWETFSWKPEEERFTLLNCAGCVQSIRRSSWSHLPNLFSLTTFHPCLSHQASCKPSSPPASDWCNHPCFCLYTGSVLRPTQQSQWDFSNGRQITSVLFPITLHSLPSL